MIFASIGAILKLLLVIMLREETLARRLIHSARRKDGQLKDDGAGTDDSPKLGCCVVAHTGLDFESKPQRLKAKMESAFVTLESQCKKPVASMLAIRIFAPFPSARNNSCIPVLSDMRLLSHVGQVLLEAARSWPTSDDAWAEGQYLKENPKMVGSQVNVNRGMAVVAACPLYGRSPTYGARPSQFLRWFACQDLRTRSVRKLVSAMGLPSNTTETRLQLRLKRQLVSSVYTYLVWSILVIEQALNEEPKSPLASVDSLENAMNKLQVWKDTVPIVISPPFTKTDKKVWDYLGQPDGSLSKYKRKSRWEALREVQTWRLWNAALTGTRLLYRQHQIGMVPVIAGEPSLVPQANRESTALAAQIHPQSVLPSTVIHPPVIPSNALVNGGQPMPPQPPWQEEVGRDPSTALSVLSSPFPIVGNGIPAFHIAAELGKKAIQIRRDPEQVKRQEPDEATAGLVVAAELQQIQEYLSKGQLNLFFEPSDDSHDVATWDDEHEEGNQTLESWDGNTKVSSKAGFSSLTSNCSVLLAAWKGILSTKRIDKEEGLTVDYKYPKTLVYDSPRQKKKVLFLTPEDDHNGAFAMNTPLCQWLACWAGKGFGVVAKTVGSISQAMKTLKRFNAGSLAHVVLSGHGFQQGLFWGKSDDPDSALRMMPKPGEVYTNSNAQQEAQSTASLLDVLNSKLTSDASVIVDACSTGQGSEANVEDWVAKGKPGKGPLHLDNLNRRGHQNLFEQVKINVGERTVYAPTRPYSVNDYKNAAGFGSGDCTPDVGEGHHGAGHISSYTFESGNGGRVVQALLDLNND